MDLSIILQKAAGGEVLNDEERSFLREYRPGGENEIGELKNQLQSTISERDSVRAELESLRFRNSVSRLAGEHKFTDPEYLEYLCRKEGIDPESPESSKGFMDKLRDNSPRFFKVELSSGPDTSITAAGRENAPRSIAGMLAQVPAFSE